MLGGSMIFCSWRSGSACQPLTVGRSPAVRHPLSRGKSPWFPSSLAPCHQAGAHRPRPMVRGNEEQSHDSLEVYHEARQHALVQYAPLTTIAGMAHIVTPHQLGQLAFDRRVAATDLVILRRLRLRLGRRILRLVVVLDDHPTLRVRLRQAVAPQRAA